MTKVTEQSRVVCPIEDDKIERLRREITEMEQRYEQLMERIDKTQAYQRRMDHPRDRRRIQMDNDELEDFACRCR